MREDPVVLPAWLIFAHAYGIPAAWIRLSGQVLGDGFKFLDYCSSIGIAAKDVPMLVPGAPLETLAQQCHSPPCPIDETRLESALFEGMFA